MALVPAVQPTKCILMSLKLLQNMSATVHYGTGTQFENTLKVEIIHNVTLQQQ